MGDRSARFEGAIDSRLVAELITAGGRPWALLSDSMDLLVAAVQSGVVVSGPFPDEPRKTARRGRVAVVPLHGVITPNGGGALGALLGMGGGLDTFREQLVNAVEDETVGEVVIDVNSPGGLTDQVPETAALVRRLRDVKPIKAVANTMAGSAGYWIASQASELFVAPSGEVGAIGAYMMHTDKSGALEQAGINVTLTSAGRFKTEGNTFEPLTDEAADARQRKVNLFYDKFATDVAHGRGVSKADVIGGYGEGRVLLAELAVDAGLADRVATLEEVVGEALAAAPEEGRVHVTAPDPEKVAAMIELGMDPALIWSPAEEPDAEADDEADGE